MNSLVNEVVTSSQSDILLVGLQNKEQCPSYYEVVLYTAKDITQKSNSVWEKTVTILTISVNVVMLCMDILTAVRIKANTRMYYVGGNAEVLCLKRGGMRGNH